MTGEEVKQQPQHKSRMVIVPCSGIGKTYGTVSREEAYAVTDHLRPAIGAEIQPGGQFSKIRNTHRTDHRSDREGS
jgi:hypothetical protein